MTITIELPVELETRLLERARATGQDVKALVQQIVAREVQSTLSQHSNQGQTAASVVAEDEPPRADMTFDEILAPIRKDFAESGMTDAELDKLLQEAIDEVRAERRKARQ